MREQTRCRHIGYSFRLTARVLLYAPSHRQDSTYHGLCYTSRGALAGTRNSSMGPPHEGSIRPKWKEGNVLFSEGLNTFSLRKVKDYPDSERRNLLPPLQGLFYMHRPTDKIAHTTASYTCRGDLAVARKS